MKKLVFLFVLFCSTVALFSQINVELKNDREYRGVFLSNSSDSLQIESKDITFEDDYSNNIFDFHRVDFINKNKRNNLKTQYFELGITLGTPGGININCGYVYKDFGIRAAIGSIPVQMYGYQFKLFYNLISINSFEIGLSVGYGYNYSSSWPFGDFERKYLGLFTHINLSGFFIEYSRGYDIENLSNFKHLFQIGFIYRFNK